MKLSTLPTLALLAPAAVRASSAALRITLAADAGASDIGYTRTVQRPHSNLVTVYYYNDNPRTERYIAATIWDPGN
jgi:hypothetical protein